MSAPDLTAIALAGVAASPSAELTSGAPVDALPLPGEDRGRDVLLRAGSAAVYRLAGRVAVSDIALPEPAPTETQPICSTEAAALLSTLLANANYNDLLIETFNRMARVGVILPPTLVPLALADAPYAARPALLPVIGERGRWLAQHNPQWAWAAVSPAASETLPPDAETIWQEGGKEQRIAVLTAMRASDPARAREWLSVVWKKEGVKIRETMLETFWTGLAPDDEEFLESVLNTSGDRAASARETAAKMLARITESALTGRMRARGDAALTFTDGKLDARPPTTLDEQWARDFGSPHGIEVQDGKKKGWRATWLTEILANIPPSYWSERFGQSPAELVAASAGSSWRGSILLGWTRGARDFADSTWAQALWDGYLALPEKEFAQYEADLYNALQPLAMLLAPEAREAFALRMLTIPDLQPRLALDHALEWLPTPWNVTVSRAYLRQLTAFVASLSPDSRIAEPWDVTLERAALALPEELFAETREALAALAGLESQGEATRMTWQMTRFNNQMNAFADKIQMRERIKKVIEA